MSYPGRGMRCPAPGADVFRTPLTAWPATAGGRSSIQLSVEAERGDAFEEGRSALASGHAESARAAFRLAVEESPRLAAVEDLDGAMEAVDAEAASFGSRRKAAAFADAWARLWLGRALLSREDADEAETEALAAGEAFRSLGADAGLRAATELADVARERSPAHGPIAAMRGPVEGSPLSAREVEILRLVSQGLSNHGIARVLVLSDHTIHRHVANILTKLGVSTRTAAVGVAARRGIL